MPPVIVIVVFKCWLLFDVLNILPVLATPGPTCPWGSGNKHSLHPLWLFSNFWSWLLQLELATSPPFPIKPTMQEAVINNLTYQLPGEFQKGSELVSSMHNTPFKGRHLQFWPSSLIKRCTPGKLKLPPIFYNYTYWLSINQVKAILSHSLVPYGLITCRM